MKKTLRWLVNGGPGIWFTVAVLVGRLLAIGGMTWEEWSG